MPIVDIQRRNTEAGRIRAGDKDDKGNPRKGKNWRLTSRDEVRLVAASKEWGGKVRPWEARPGEFELYTSTDTLPIMLVPGYLATTWYELWSAAGCQRRCDGVHEVISDKACMCDADDRECGPHTRLSVMLPDLPGIGMWLVQSTGWNAASELSAANDVLERASVAGVLLPGRLILEQRERRTPGKPVRKFAVPTLDIDVTLRTLMAGGTAGALPAAPAGEPIGAGASAIPSTGVSVADGLDAVQREQVALPRANAAEPIGEPIVAAAGASDDAPVEESVADTGPSDTTPSAGSGDPGATAGTGLGDDVPVPSGTDDDEPGAAQKTLDDEATAAPTADADDASGAPPPPPRVRMVTGEQKKALNALYGQLKEIPTDGGGNITGAPVVTIGGLYAWAAKQRNIDVDLMIDTLNDSAMHAEPPKTLARDAKGKLHFPPLRDSLTFDEASGMLDGMIGLKERAEAAS